MSEAERWKELEGKGGVVDRTLKNAPLRITEKPHPHRAATETECYDCKMLIAKGEPFIVSALEVTKGVMGQTYRYSDHEACYDVVGRVSACVGKESIHTLKGRAPLGELWAAHHEAIDAGDPELAGMLEGVFGRVK